MSEAYDGEPDEKEEIVNHYEPEQCSECNAWGRNPDDHASTCSRYEEQCLPF